MTGGNRQRLWCQLIPLTIDEDRVDFAERIGSRKGAIADLRFKYEFPVGLANGLHCTVGL